MKKKDIIYLSKQLFFFSALFTILRLNATVYYVDSEIGNSSYNGSSESTPWDSLQTVCSKSSTFQPGDIIKFKRGQRFYNFLNGNLNCSGTSSVSQIVFQSYGDFSQPAPVLSTGKRIDQEASWTDLGNGRYLYTGYVGFVVAFLWEDGFPIKKASSSALTDGYWYLVSGTGIYVRPTDLQAYSSHEYYLSNNTVILGITNCSYLKFADLSFEYSKTGIYTGSSAVSEICGIDITNCTFSKMCSGIRINSTSTSLENHDISVTNNIFTDVRFAFICTGLDTAARHYNLNISGNYITNVCIDGAYALNDTSPDVEVLSFQNLHDSVISKNIIEHGIKYSDGITDIQNEPLGAGGIVIWVHPDALVKNVQISNNIITDIARGIAFGSGVGYFLQDNQISGNIIEDCEIGMRLNSSSYSGEETTVENNQLYCNNINTCLYSGVRGYLVTNNISFWPAQYHVQFYQSWQFTDSTLNDNCYIPDGALWRYEPSTTYSNFAAWQTAGQDNNSVAIDDTGLKLWLKTDAGALNEDGLPADVDEGVQSWLDQSSNGWNFSCSFYTRRPTLKNNASPNGAAGLYFNGTSNCMNMPNKSGTLKSIYIAFSNENTISKSSASEVILDLGTVEELVFGSCTTLLTDELLTVFSKNSTAFQCRSGYTSDNTQINADFHVMAIILNQAEDSFDIYLDGNMINNATYGSDDTPLTINDTCYLGGRDLAGSYFKGYIFEIIGFDVAHGSNQIGDIMNYLETKYDQ